MYKISRIITVLFFMLGMQATAQLAPNLFVYPNPFWSQIILEISTNKSDTSSLGIYDSAGKKIHTFFTKVLLPVGVHLIKYDGDSLPAGMYRAVYIHGDSEEIAKIVKVDAINSIHEVKLQNPNFTAFPNPTKELVTIPIEGQKTIRIFAADGRLCKTIETDRTVISLTGLSAGSYQISVQSQETKHVTTFIIQKTE